MMLKRITAGILTIVCALTFTASPLMEASANAASPRREPDLVFYEPEVLWTRFSRFPASKWCTKAKFTVFSRNGVAFTRGTMTIDPNYNLGWNVDIHGGVSSSPRRKPFNIFSLTRFERKFCWQPDENTNREVLITFRGPNNFVQKFKWCVIEGSRDPRDHVNFSESPPDERKSCKGL